MNQLEYRQKLAERYYAEVAARSAARKRQAAKPASWSFAGILLAPVRVVGLAAAFVFECVASINPLQHQPAAVGGLPAERRVRATTMTEKQAKSLLAFAKRGSEVIGRKRCPVPSWMVLYREGYVRPEGQNTSPHTGTWLLTEQGIQKVASLLRGERP